MNLHFDYKKTALACLWQIIHSIFCIAHFIYSFEYYTETIIVPFVSPEEYLRVLLSRYRQPQ